MIKWDSVTILNNFNVNLYVEVTKRNLKQNRAYVRLFKAVTDSLTANELEIFFAEYANKSGYHTKTKNTCYRKWYFFEREVLSGCEKGKYFLIINNQEYFKKKK